MLNTCQHCNFTWLSRHSRSGFKVASRVTESCKLQHLLFHPDGWHWRMAPVLVLATDRRYPEVVCDRWFRPSQTKFVHIQALHFPALVILPRASGHVKVEKKMCKIHATKWQLTILIPYFWSPNRTSHLCCRQKNTVTRRQSDSKKAFQYKSNKKWMVPQLWSLKDSRNPSPFKTPRRFEANLWSDQDLRVPSLESMRCNESSFPPSFFCKPKERLHSMLLMVNTIMTLRIWFQKGNLQIRIPTVDINITSQVMMQDPSSTLFNPYSTVADLTNLHHHITFVPSPSGEKPSGKLVNLETQVKPWASVEEWKGCPRDSTYATKIYIASAHAFTRLRGLHNSRSTAYAAL